MRYLVSGREMQQYDANTTEYFKVPSLLLMEQAALALTEEIKKAASGEERILIACGIGNNGADGLAAARMLLLDGKNVDIVSVGDRKKATNQWNTQYEILHSYGFPVLEDIPEDVTYDVVADAVFGVGLSRDITGIYAEKINQLNRMAAKKIAVDVPTGICSDTGAVLGTAFRADITVTFAFEKTGLYLWPGNEYAGQIITKAIGITKESFLGERPAVQVLEEPDIDRLPKRLSHSNKGTYGKVLLIAGSIGMAGAAVLSAKAACTAGCGLVRVFTPEENRGILQIQVPEAILTTYKASEINIAALNEAMAWADAIICGPGIGKSDISREIVKNVLQQKKVPVVLDADALNLIAEDISCLKASSAKIIVTPHMGEMSRLTAKKISQIQSHMIETAKTFSKDYNVVCVLKDERTVIAAPSGSIYLNLSGNNGMATAGSGDVLAGITGSFAAQGMDLEKAGAFGAFLHGMAGDAILPETGYRGMTANDIILGLKKVFANRQI